MQDLRPGSTRLEDNRRQGLSFILSNASTRIVIVAGESSTFIKERMSFMAGGRWRVSERGHALDYRVSQRRRETSVKKRPCLRRTALLRHS